MRPIRARCRLQSNAPRCFKNEDGVCLGSGTDDPNSWLDVAIGIIVNFESEVASISLGAFRTLSLLNIEELGKGFAVLVTIGEGFRRNDVVNRGDVD